MYGFEDLVALDVPLDFRFGKEKGEYFVGIRICMRRIAGVYFVAICSFMPYSLVLFPQPL